MIRFGTLGSCQLQLLLCGATDRDDMPLVQWQGAKIVSSTWMQGSTLQPLQPGEEQLSESLMCLRGTITIYTIQLWLQPQILGALLHSIQDIPQGIICRHVWPFTVQQGR